MLLLVVQCIPFLFLLKIRKMAEHFSAIAYETSRRSSQTLPGNDIYWQTEWTTLGIIAILFQVVSDALSVFSDLLIVGRQLLSGIVIEQS